MTHPLRIAVLGCGRIGQMHAELLARRVPGATVSFVYDAVPEASASVGARLGIPVASSVDEILVSDQVDAVAICSSTDTHVELMIGAAQAGKAIFCEKPVDLSVERVRACLEVVRACKAKLMIGFNRRFDPNFASVRKRIADGAIGQVEIVQITSRDPSPPPVSYIERSGGLFRDMMIHDFDMARFLLGEELVSVSAFGSSLVDPEIGKAGDVDTAVVILQTKSGKVCEISNSRRATYGYDQRVEAHGSKGMLAANNILETTVEHSGAHGITTDKVLNFFLERYDSAYRSELDAFVKAVKAGVEPSPSGQDGLLALVLADAAYQSWKTGQTVKLS